MMTRCFVMVLLLASGNLPAQYLPAWESLDKRPVPEWWKDARFGVFIHWGIYSVPAYAPVNEVEGVYEKYAEHYMNRLLQGNKLFVQHHQKYYGADITYRHLAARFKAEYFDPDSWADLIQRSGARYVVLTSKHHDGYCLWPGSESPGWNSADLGPHRDLVGELTAAVRKKGLHMGLYYSLLEWDHPLYGPATIGEWVDRHIMPQMKELVTAYKPEVIFADGEWDYTSRELKSEQFLAWLFNESPVKNTVVVNDRWGKETRSRHGSYFTTEYDLVHDKAGIGALSMHPWEESRGIGTSYGYNRFETTDHYFTSKQLIDLLIEKVSNGGNLLLNIGPRADGLIPVIMQERLLDIGKWLRVNGQAIYGTAQWTGRPEHSSDKGIFYTRKGDDLYVICTQWPGKPVVVDRVNRVEKVTMLGTGYKIKYTHKGDRLVIEPPLLHPANIPCDHAWVFSVEGFEAGG